MVPTQLPPAAFTAKGTRTRGRIVAAAAQLIHDHGVASTTIEQVRAAAEVSGSQLYHYFADKDALVEAVIDNQADAIVRSHEDLDLGTIEGLRTWRNLVLAQSRSADGRGGCPLGSLVGQLAESETTARDHLAIGFQRWIDAVSTHLRTAQAAGRLPAGIEPADLAVTLLAALQGGLVLAQARRDTVPLETALNTMLTLIAPDQEPLEPSTSSPGPPPRNRQDD
ncbi:TetR family transcriptional regulator [Nakamurella sp. A5-74]|uniref:TetR family transcriptional regulator n=1 Tax=Nakamurella sp. A5-74 TaxID=3158264 RepID=A0AAU8DS22_9ACTN